MMISFRLTKEDGDLIGRINDIPRQMRSSVYRKALRLLLLEERQKAVIYPIFKADNPTLSIELSESEKRSQGNIDLDENLDNALNF